MRPDKIRAIYLILQGKSHVDVAKEIGVTKRTFTRWMKKGTIFRRLLEREQYALWEVSSQQLKNLYAKSISVVSALLDNSNEKIRLRAAATVLGHIKLEEPPEVVEGKS